MLNDAHLFAKIGVDTAEQEPSEILKLVVVRQQTKDLVASNHCVVDQSWSVLGSTEVDRNHVHSLTNVETSRDHHAILKPRQIAKP